VFRPRLPSIPLGGRFIEHRMWAIRLLPELRAVGRELECQIVHAHFALPDGHAAAEFAIRAQVPFVLTVRGDDVLVFGERFYTRTVLKRTFKHADAVIAVSEELAERATTLGARSDSTWVIPGGVPYRPAGTRNEIRESLGLARETVCILWVGGLVPVKQPLDAVAAFRLLLAQLQELDAVLVVIGDGALASDLRIAVRGSLAASVRLLGYRPREEVWRWQCAADVLINTSRSEGTPIAALEAQGAGTPVIGYPLSGLGSVVDSLSGGALAAEATPAALAHAIAVELETPRDRDALACAARERYGIDRVGKEIDRVYESVR
jgi:glycosyltransferase involved in cell wall biosynthesis